MCPGRGKNAAQGKFDVLGEADIIMASRVRWRTVANIAPDSAVTVGQGRKALSVWRAFALAVATKEATDKDSNVLHGRTAHESAVAIRKPADAGNGYRFAKLLRPTQRTRILPSRLCSSQLNPRPGNSPSSLSFEKMHAGWRKPPASVGRRGFIFPAFPRPGRPGGVFASRPYAWRR